MRGGRPRRVVSASDKSWKTTVAGPSWLEIKDRERGKRATSLEALSSRHHIAALVAKAIFLERASDLLCAMLVLSLLCLCKLGRY